MENININNYTPMIRQYLTIKEQYPDTLVFYRVGDFYEMFFNDAVIASRELELVLTKKDAGITNQPVPMAGVPYHAVETYIERLSEKGYRIAVVDQMEEANPHSTKIVNREVTKVITPGTNIDENFLNEKGNNYIAALDLDIKNNKYYLAYIDISTGDSNLTILPNYLDTISAELQKLSIKEIIVSNKIPKNNVDFIKNVLHILVSNSLPNELDNYMLKLYNNLDIHYQPVCLLLLNYISTTQKRSLVHLKPFVLHNPNEYLVLDYKAINNLELINSLNNQEHKNTLFQVLDQCKTAMGSRFLKRSILYPLTNLSKINNRLDIIDELIKNYLYLDDLSSLLLEIYDLERIIGRLSYGSISPKDLLNLKSSLKCLPLIKALLKRMKGQNLNKISFELLEFTSLTKLLEDSIDENPHHLLREGGFIKKGFNQELDEIKNLNHSNTQYLLDLEMKEKMRTGIKNLKVGYNKVFGYYIEITKPNLSLIKDEYGYIRKQTTTNGERFITQELKEKETLILNSRDLSIELEIKLFNEIKEECKKEIINIQKTATLISELDMLLSLAKVARSNHYVRPEFNMYGDIEILGGRHPVLEKVSEKDNPHNEFIPNDLVMNKLDSILLITGPNMGGKSTYIRQNALISIMAQMGSFVPCDKCLVPLFDQIFSRIGASDNLSKGESTFMVEMKEVNDAIQKATYNSLILFDEVGRGTATFDGLALAWSIIEYISQNIGCKTLFSTHYHELTSLESQLPNLKNIHVEAKDNNGNIVFLHKIKEGATDKSFGVHVAKLAKLPSSIIFRANDILKKITQDKEINTDLLSYDNYQEPISLDNLNQDEEEVISYIKNIHIDDLKPIEALITLKELKDKLEGDNHE